jgi:hypothetical protein
MLLAMLVIMPGLYRPAFAPTFAPTGAPTLAATDVNEPQAPPQSPLAGADQARSKAAATIPAITGTTTTTPTATTASTASTASTATIATASTGAMDHPAKRFLFPPLAEDDVACAYFAIVRADASLSLLEKEMVIYLLNDLHALNDCRPFDELFYSNAVVHLVIRAMRHRRSGFETEARLHDWFAQYQLLAAAAHKFKTEVCQPPVCKNFKMYVNLAFTGPVKKTA